MGCHLPSSCQGTPHFSPPPLPSILPGHPLLWFPFILLYQPYLLVLLPARRLHRFSVHCTRKLLAAICFHLHLLPFASGVLIVPLMPSAPICLRVFDHSVMLSDVIHCHLLPGFDAQSGPSPEFWIICDVFPFGFFCGLCVLYSPFPHC